MRVALALAGHKRIVWDSLRRKLADGKPFNILVLGGSETLGTSCRDGDPTAAIDNTSSTAQQCSWSGRFRDWLVAAYPRVNVTLFNEAKTGCTTECVLPMLFAKVSRAKPDLVLSEFTVNDAGSGSVAPSSFATSEALVRQLLSYDATLDILFVVTFPDARGRSLDILPLIARHTFWVDAQYPGNVATISYMDVAECALSPVYNGGGTLPRRKNHRHDFWRATNGGAHPGWKTHQLIADTVAYVFHNAVTCGRSFADQPLTPPERLEQLSQCAVPLSYFDSADPGTLARAGDVVASPGGWRLMEDRPGKHGWITIVPGSSISFVVQFGARPSLTVTYLMSYETLGDALLTFGGRQARAVLGFDDIGSNKRGEVSEVRLFGLYKSIRHGADSSLEKVSQSFEPPMTIVHVQPHSSMKVTVTATTASNKTAPYKFKLLSVSSC